MSEGTPKSNVSLEGQMLKFNVVGVIDDVEAEKLHDVGVETLDSGAAELVLINLEGTHRFSPSARSYLVAFLRNANIKKTAIVGGNVFMRTVASFVMAAAKVDNIKFFTETPLALAWLKNN